MLEGKKVLIVIAHDVFRDEEYAEPREVLETAGAEVIVASSGLSEARGRFGLAVHPDILVKDAEVSDYDAVVFVGGGGSREYFNDPSALRLARDADDEGKVLAAICIAPHILANADVLKGKKATTYESEIGALKEKGAIYTDKDVQVDGKLITARGPEAARDFGEEVVNALQRM